MNILDFISDSPKAYIFSNKTNKTNLGGICTFIYFIVLIFLSVIYIIDFQSLHKYEFTYFYKPTNKNEKENLKSLKDLNSDQRFYIEIYDQYGNKSNENFRFFSFYSEDINNIDNETIKNPYYMDKTYKKKLNQLNIFVIYQKEKCDLKNESNNQYTFNLFYETKSIDLDNAKSPVKNNVLGLYYYFYLKEFSSWMAYFTIYNFEETKGAFSRFYDNIAKSQSEISPYFAQFGRSQKLDYNIPDSQACGNTTELGDFKLVFLYND